MNYYFFEYIYQIDAGSIFFMNWECFYCQIKIIIIYLYMEKFINKRQSSQMHDRSFYINIFYKTWILEREHGGSPPKVKSRKVSDWHENTILYKL